LGGRAGILKRQNVPRDDWAEGPIISTENGTGKEFTTIGIFHKLFIIYDELNRLIPVIYEAGRRVTYT
jgi:hypothetical protein